MGKMTAYYLKNEFIETNGFPNEIPNAGQELKILVKDHKERIKKLRQALYAFPITNPTGPSSIVDFVLETDKAKQVENNYKDDVPLTYFDDPGDLPHEVYHRSQFVRRRIHYPLNSWQKNFYLNKKFIHQDFTDMLLESLHRETYLLDDFCFEGMSVSKNGNISVIGEIISPKATNFNVITRKSNHSPEFETFYKEELNPRLKVYNLTSELRWANLRDDDVSDTDRTTKEEYYYYSTFQILEQAFQAVAKRKMENENRRVCDALKLQFSERFRRCVANAPMFEGTQIDALRDVITDTTSYYFQTDGNLFTFVDHTHYKVLEMTPVKLYSSFPKTIEQHQIGLETMRKNMAEFNKLLTAHHFGCVEKYRMVPIEDKEINKIRCSTVVFAPTALETTMFDLCELPNMCKSVRFNRFNQPELNRVNFAVETLEGFDDDLVELRKRSGGTYAEGFISKQIAPFEVETYDLGTSLPTVIQEIIKDYAFEGKHLIDAYAKMKTISEYMGNYEHPEIAVYYDSKAKSFCAHKLYTKKVPTNTDAKEDMVFLTENLFNYEFAHAFEPMRRALMNILPVIDYRLGGAVLMLGRGMALYSRNVGGYSHLITDQTRINPDVIVHQSFITTDLDVRLKAVKKIHVNWRAKQDQMTWMPRLQPPDLKKTIRAIDFALEKPFCPNRLHESRYITNTYEKDSYQFISDMLDHNHDGKCKCWSEHTRRDEAKDIIYYASAGNHEYSPELYSFYRSTQYQPMKTVRHQEIIRAPSSLGLNEKDLITDPNRPYQRNETAPDKYERLGPFFGGDLPRSEPRLTRRSNNRNWRNINLYNYKGFHSFDQL